MATKSTHSKDTRVKLQLTSRCPKCGAPIYSAIDTETKSAEKVYTVSEPHFTCVCRLEITITTTPTTPSQPFPWYQPFYNGNGHYTQPHSNTICLNGNHVGPMTSGYMRIIGSGEENQ